MDFYLVKEGETTLLLAPGLIKHISDTCNWQDECLCYVGNEEEALDLAELYDSGLIQQDNIIVHGYGTFIALRKRGG